ncbi:MAG TPA: cation:proton antiporter [Bacteroidales bacterium]|nr:MAG: cation:proton antiporter [Bacteroidetes bacterium GWF2_33_38]HBF87232.1 cation:proton antiporter [Bacteroidales bacterium]
MINTEYFTLGHISLLLGFILIIVGFWGILTQKNIVKIILAFSIADAGINILIVSLGYVIGKTAPIIDGSVVQKAGIDVSDSIVDPVPQALVLTSIVIGFGVTALMLAYAMKLFTAKKTLHINKFNDLKW